ncbi:MAG: hypothetical protein MUC48_24680 [Leptolyngbya sp. Prado105]|jgi:uncharacterized membrane protein|nr:hypothetical protein [Leptolyngbya sp. Prado105]
MKPKPIEFAAYSIIGAGCGIFAAIIVGSIMQFTLQHNEQKLDRFNAVFWALTVPTLTIACGFATGSAHFIVSALRRSMLQSESEPVQPQAVQGFSNIAESALFPQSNESVAPVADVRSQFETLYAAPEHPSFVPEQAPKSNHPLDL